MEQLFRGFAARDNALAFEVFDDEVVLDTREMSGPDSIRAVYHGHDGVRRYWREWLDAWEAVTIVDGPLNEMYGGQVISSWRQLNRGKTSGLEVEMDVASIWTFQHDRVVRMATFASRDDALRAAGVPG